MTLKTFNSPVINKIKALRVNLKRLFVRLIINVVMTYNLVINLRLVIFYKVSTVKSTSPGLMTSINILLSLK